MKTLSLLTVILAATIVHAKTVLPVVCEVPAQQKVSVTFEGSGTVTIEDNGEASAEMYLDITGPGVEKSFQEFYTGKAKTIPAGQYMATQSYDVQLQAEHVTGEKSSKPMSLKMFLGGPKNQVSAQVVLDGAQYRSTCNIISFKDMSEDDLFDLDII